MGLNREPQDVTFASVDSSTDVFNTTLRFDAWILPFWNLCVIGGQAIFFTTLAGGSASRYQFRRYGQYHCVVCLPLLRSLL